MSRSTLFIDLIPRLLLVALLLLADTVQPAGRVPMNPPDVPGFARLMKLGRTLVADTVPEQSRQSLPIPVRANGQLQVIFLYCPAQAMPGVVRMAPPHFMTRLEPSVESLLSVTAVSPAYFRQPHSPDELIGEFRLPEGMTGEQYLTMRERLFALYDQLAPAFASDTRAARTDLKPAAVAFLRMFTLLSEPPIRAYYEVSGAEFFSWLRSISR